MRSFVLYCLIFFATVLPASAQNSCEVTLNHAQEEFNAGRFHGVPTLLKECLESNQNREWNQRAYLLLAETYLLLEDALNANESYLKVLRANPEFETDAARDPIDLVYLSKKFTATPLFSVHAKIGLNASFIRVIHDVRISTQGDVKEDYAMKAGWQGGVGLDYHYNSTWSLSGEMNYAFTSFSHTVKNLFHDGSYNLAFTDRQTWINVPIMVKYSATARGLRPFVYGGYAVSALLRDRADMIIDGDTESPVFDYKYKRNTLNTSLIIGAGLKYKWGLRYIFGDIRYSRGLSNLTNVENRFDVINQGWPYVDDDFRMDNIFLSIGYIHPFYKARLLKKPKTKSVLRKFRKTDETN